MATKNPRVNMVLEPPLYKVLKKIARRESVSMSQKARDLVKESLEVLEDLELAKIARQRRRTFNHSKVITHTQMLNKWLPKGKRS